MTDERAGHASGADVATEERARVALAVVFFACGIALASWISRIPGARDSLGPVSYTHLTLPTICSV